MNNTPLLEDTVAKLVIKGKGILAADESTNTITKRFKSINLESTEETRRNYREVLFTTPKLGDYISGVILYEETLNQKTQAGQAFADVLLKQGIIPGIKVDKGIIPLPNSPQENITQGLDGLGERLKQYKSQGARFAKWRAVIPILPNVPSYYGMHANAEALARYAAICQAEGIVPIVEPEVLMDGDHSIDRCYEVTEQMLHQVFNALYIHRVQLEYIILKPNMVVSGKDHPKRASIAEVAEKTMKVLRRTVPIAVPSINFLSGGQTDEEATAHLNAMNQLANNTWHLSFSYGRALQAPALKSWAGANNNKNTAQNALLKRAQLNSHATLGNYEHSME